MKHLWEMIVAMVCMAALLFVVGMRSGLHDAEIKSEAELKQLEDMYVAQVDNLNLALEKERQIEHVVVTYEYKPLPVDYNNIGVFEPEEDELIAMARCVYGEYRNTDNYNQITAVIWNILNRVDAGYGSIIEVCTGGQYHGYNENNPIDAEVYNLCREIYYRWQLEKIAVNTDVGRTLPKDYLWFEGNGTTNTFRNAYKGGDHITP